MYFDFYFLSISILDLYVAFMFTAFYIFTGVFFIVLELLVLKGYGLYPFCLLL